MHHRHRTAEAARAARAIATEGTDRPQADHRERRAGAPGRALAWQEAVRVRAYHAWEAAGRPAGDGVEFWLRAEQETGPQDGEWDAPGGHP